MIKVTETHMMWRHTSNDMWRHLYQLAATSNIIDGDGDIAEKAVFTFITYSFYPESDSLNNSYQWKSPLGTQNQEKSIWWEPSIFLLSNISLFTKILGRS